MKTFDEYDEYGEQQEGWFTRLTRIVFAPLEWLEAKHSAIQDKVLDRLFPKAKPENVVTGTSFEYPDPIDGKYYCMDNFGTHSFTTLEELQQYKNDLFQLAADMTPEEWSAFKRNWKTQPEERPLISIESHEIERMARKATLFSLLQLTQRTP